MRLIPRADGHGRVPGVEVMIATPFIRACIINKDKTRVLHEAIAAGGSQDALVPVDLLDLRRIQPAVREVAGLTRYEVASLRADGTPDDATTVRVADRLGVAANLRSRAEGGAPLTGTKRQVVADRRLFLGVGRGDGRRIAILPMLGSDRHVTGLVLLPIEFHAALPRDPKLEMLAPKLGRAFVAAALGGVGDKDPLPWHLPLSVDANYSSPVDTLTNGATGILDIL